MKLDPSTAAVMTLDLQQGIFSMGDIYKSVLPTAEKVLNFARAQGFVVLHVGLGFSVGHPEVSDVETPFLRAKQNNLFVKGTPSAEFAPGLVKENETIIYKHRVSAFSENQLDMILRSRGIKNLVLFGISTSGIVLSTMTRAFDLDYRLTVIRDACTDADSDVHRILMDHVFAKRGQVVTADEFIKSQNN